MAPSVSAYNASEEIAGAFSIKVRGNAGVKLDDVYVAITEALTDFEKKAFSDDQLKRIKAETETAFYYRFEDLQNRALQLGRYNEYAGSARFFTQDIANITSVTREDIMRVFKQYIKNKPAIITSFVPKDQQQLMLIGSTKANVVEEEIKQGTEQQFIENDAIKYQKTPTQHDRSEPALTALPMLKVPDIRQNTLNNGMAIYGIEQNELPILRVNH